ncbi:MAG: type IV toxin-antitoxin system AbiEi family antitoxin domain-containing protein, partial [Planctomycetota bacterium]
IHRIFRENRAFWRLPVSMSRADFIRYLTKNAELKKEVFPFSYGTIVRYTWSDVPLFELLLTLKRRSYFTHYTAMYLHELTEQIPKTIYITWEQDPKPRPKGKLEQGRINWAFKRPTRLSNNTADYQNRKLCLLNGMFTNNLGVTEMPGAEGETLRLTDVERTLIDITVRPEYAGGVFEVLKAYRLAKVKVSINRLVATLRKINYIYPYHQAIGFYLEKAAVYNQSQLDLLRRFEINYDFYLMHQMKDCEYSEKWRLYFPKGFK